MNDRDSEEKSDWKDLTQLKQGQLSMKVTDSQGNVKEHQRYARVEGEGSIVAHEVSSGSSVQGLGDGKAKRVMKRRDKIPGLAKGKGDK